MDYNKILADVVIPKLKEFGTERSLKRRALNFENWVKSYSPTMMKYVWINSDTGEVKIDESFKQEEYSLFKINTLIETFKTKEIDGQLVKAGDIKVYIDPSTKVELNDLIDVDGKDYSVYHLDPIKPANVLLLYIAYVRTFKYGNVY